MVGEGLEREHSLSVLLLHSRSLRHSPSAGHLAGKVRQRWEKGIDGLSMEVLKHLWMWQLGTRGSGGPGGAVGTAGLDGLRGFFQPKS